MPSFEKRLLIVAMVSKSFRAIANLKLRQLFGVPNTSEGISKSCFSANALIDSKTVIGF